MYSIHLDWNCTLKISTPHVCCELSILRQILTFLLGRGLLGPALRSVFGADIYPASPVRISGEATLESTFWCLKRRVPG